MIVASRPGRPLALRAMCSATSSASAAASVLSLNQILSSTATPEASESLIRTRRYSKARLCQIATMKHRREMPRVYTEPLLDKNEKPPVESHIDFTSPLRKDKEKPKEETEEGERKD